MLFCLIQKYGKQLFSYLFEHRAPHLADVLAEFSNRARASARSSRLKEYGCLPLDCDCPMFGICFTNSALCKYFCKSVLPEDAGLEAVFTKTPPTLCKQCGKPFPTDGKRVYCSQHCAEGARRKQTAARVRKYRAIHYGN